MSVRVGYGLVGFCLGPALVNIAGVSLPVLVFVIAMAGGMVAYDLWKRTAFRQLAQGRVFSVPRGGFLVHRSRKERR